MTDSRTSAEDPAPTLPRDVAPWDWVQCQPGVLGLYESNYVRGLSPDGNTALWIKHNLLAPRDPRQPALLELWAVLHRRGERPQVLWQRRPAAEVTLGTKVLNIQGPCVLLTREHTASQVVDTSLAGEPRVAQWDIGLQTAPAPLGAPLVHYPNPRMYTWPLPKKKILTPAPLLHLAGWFDWQGERLDLTGWTGLRNHNWGTEHAHQYAFATCNTFDGAPGWLLDGLSARLKVAGLVLPPLSVALVRTPDGDRPFNDLAGAVRVQAEIAFPRWRAEFHQHGRRMRVDIAGDPTEFAGLRYHHPGGAVSYCYNSKFAKLTLELDGRQLTSDRAELEFAFAQPLADIPVIGP